MITLYTIGFTKKSAEHFFELLKENQVKKLIDVRISNNSQLAGFAKGKDLEYFVRQICRIDYCHIVDFAPTEDLLNRLRRKEVDWSGYEKEYISLLDERGIMKRYEAREFHCACFLCSEDTPERCHRRLLAEYIKKHSREDVVIKHLR